MLKSNSKLFKTKVQNYILDCIDIENIDDPTITEKLQYIVDCFEIEKFKPYKEQYKKLFNVGVNKQAVFIDWLQGLPSSINLEFSTYDIKQLLISWYEESEEQAEKYNNVEIDKQFYTLIYNNFVDLCKQNNIKF